jgi:hypothetical protein
MAGHCTLSQPADEIGRVYAVPAKTASCKTACHETLEVIAVNKVEEACNVKRPQGRTATCVGTTSATAEQKAKCAAAAIDANFWAAACAKSAVAPSTATLAGTCQLTAGGAGCQPVNTPATCAVAGGTCTCTLSADETQCNMVLGTGETGTDTTCTYSQFGADGGAKHAALECVYTSKGDGVPPTGDDGVLLGNLFSAVAPTTAETDAQKLICTDASKDTADTTISHCIYLEQLSCGLNRKTEDAAGADATAKAANLAKGFTCDGGLAMKGVDGECDHVLPAPAVVYKPTACEMKGVAGAPKYPTGKADAMVSADKCLDAATCVTKGTFADNCSAVEKLFGDGILGTPDTCTVATGTGMCTVNAAKNGCDKVDRTTGITATTCETFVPATNTYSAVTDECETCWDHWQLYLIDQVKGNIT